MATWVLILILSGCWFMIFLILANAIIIVAEKRIRERDKRIKHLTKENAHKQQLLDAYGIKEITIGGEEE